MSVDVVTFGCRLNAYESEAIRARAAEAGLEDAVIVNTCAVTAEAVRQSRQAIRKLRRERPEARLIVTGCAAQTEPDTYAAMPEVDQVIGNSEKLEASSYAPDFLDGAMRVRVADIMQVRETAAQFVDSFENRARAVVMVQNGCDHRCTFCIIPYGRGNSRSVGMGAVVEEAQRLVAAGYREIVLSGVDLTAYGAGPAGPADTWRTGAANSAPRAGARASAPFVDRFHRGRRGADARDRRGRAPDAAFPPLGAIGRRHDPEAHEAPPSRADTIAFCEAVRRLRPDAAFGADLIAGFPTETEAMFAGTLALVDDAGLSYLHVFPFSPRAGTPARACRNFRVAL